MSKMIVCKKLNIEAKPLERAPYPGELGKKIQENISPEAWQLWLNHQTMLINEYKLNMLDAQSRSFLKDEMQKFLFEGNAAAPAGFTPPTSNDEST